MDTGDIILFRTSNTVSNITRGYTNSHFDHVGMLLRFETHPDEIFMLDSTSNMGVALNKWSFLRKHIGKGKFYDKAVYRHINFDRSDKMLETLDKFLDQAMGHKWVLSVDKLTRDQTVKVPNIGTDKNGEERLVDKNRSFICSELVAKAFKILGVLENDNKSCAKFFPSNFSSKKANTLNLTPGTTINNELMIIVDREDLLLQS